MKTLVTCLLAIALALGTTACGADKSVPEASTTATTATTGTGTTTTETTPSGTPPKRGTDNVRGIDVLRMGRAREELVDICAARAKDPAVRGDEKFNARLRKAATRLIRDFHANPDEEFRLTPKASSISMRTRLISLRPLLRKDCGLGFAVSISTRMGIALRSKPEES